MLTTALSGLGFGFSLIVAIGAQNAYVMRQGLRREHIGVVVAICALSDIALISLGAAGVGAVVQAHPALLVVVTLLGCVVLTAYAIQAVRRAVRPEVLDADGTGEAAGLATVALTAAGLTWLNPHVYLDTVVLVGSVASTHAAPWAFALGAMLASVVWFSGLGFGARVLRPLFTRPAAWRVFDLAVAAIMISVAVGMAVNLRGWLGS